MQRLRERDVALVVVDIQERFAPVLWGLEGFIAACRMLIEGLRVLGIPILVTEQNPEKLGKTLPELQASLGDAYQPIAKKAFSAFGSDAFRKVFGATGRTQILLCGIEAHVCIVQTVLDAVKLGYEVFVASDAVTARHPFLRESGLRRCEATGAVLVNAEMALFELMETADHPAFREVQAIVKEWAGKAYLDS